MVQYAYDANGNRVSVDDGTTTTSYEYDEADQLTDLGGLTLTYDPNGNRITAGSDTFAYDWANRLTEAAVGGTTASFAYLADGTRQSKTSGATTTDYLYDREAGLPQVVDDGTTSRFDGPGGAIAEVDDATGDAVSPLADGLGSVRARADEAGAAVGTADWDAWGNLRASSGVSGEFGWAGEQRDPETGLTYLRSRYYAPGAGRFLSRDTVQPNAGGTQGWNPYAYATDNPTAATDPSGHGIAEVFGVLARVLECVLHGECRYRRQHEHTDPTKEAVSGVPSAGHAGLGDRLVCADPTNAYCVFPDPDPDPGNVGVRWPPTNPPVAHGESANDRFRRELEERDRVIRAQQLAAAAAAEDGGGSFLGRVGAFAGQVWDECNPVTERANCLLQVVAVPPYAAYYGAYGVLQARNDLAEGVGGWGEAAILVGTSPLDQVLVPIEVAGLGEDVVLDVIKDATIPGNNESIWDEGKYGNILPICNCGPEAYLPGLHYNSGLVDLAGPWGNTVDLSFLR
jgi:RHS repeat-associated protein